MRKTNTALANLEKSSNTTQRSSTSSVTGSGAVYLSVRDLVLGSNRSKAPASKSNRSDSSGKK